MINLRWGARHRGPERGKDVTRPYRHWLAREVGSTLQGGLSVIFEATVCAAQHVVRAVEVLIGLENVNVSRTGWAFTPPKAADQQGAATTWHGHADPAASQQIEVSVLATFGHSRQSAAPRSVGHRRGPRLE